MKNPIQIATSLTHPVVIGTVHSDGSLAASKRLKQKECDWLELRVDCFFPRLEALRRDAPRLPLPRIVTVRHASEGGAATGLSRARRGALYRDFLAAASLIDIELRWADRMADLIHEAKSAGIGVILSHHNFRNTPKPPKLRDLARRAAGSGADIFKVATLTNSPLELALLLEFIGNEKTRLPLAVMGMGRYGKVSRLALAQAGSCLNYGYLGTPNASGQWPVAVLKQRLAELREEGAKAPKSGTKTAFPA